MLPSRHDTIAAVATPAGSGGIGVVRVSGPRALAVCKAIWQGHDPQNSPGGRFWHGFVRDPVSGELIDEALLLVFRAPRSYTGEDAVELQTHGSAAVLRRVLQLLLDQGCRVAAPGEFTLRAFLNGRIDLAQAESVLALVEAQSDSARRQALLGLNRRLSAEIASINDDLLGLLSHIQALLDYPEEGVEPHSAHSLIDRAITRLENLLATASAGRKLLQGARLAIIGAPNAGKSSLLNALLGYRRALVANEPGTTRDYLEAPLEIGGVPLLAVDTAGIRQSEDPVEAAGVENAIAIAAAADLVLYLVDSSSPRPPEPDLPWSRTVRIASKCDLPAVWSDERFLAVSSVSGAGLNELREAIKSKLLGGADSKEVWLVSERQAETLREARDLLREARKAPEDLMGMGIEAATRALAQVSGENVDEETIARIFSNFCVGK